MVMSVVVADAPAAAAGTITYTGDLTKDPRLLAGEEVCVNTLTADLWKAECSTVVSHARGTITTGALTTAVTGNDGILTVSQKDVDNSGHVNWIKGNTDRPKLGCQVQTPVGRYTDAMNKVCGGTTAETAAADQDLRQVSTFNPAALPDVTVCGLQVYVQDDNLRRVVVSRGKCEATEGRRYWYYGFNNQVNPTEKARYEYYEGVKHDVMGATAANLPTALGLFQSNGASFGMLTENTKTPPADL